MSIKWPDGVGRCIVQELDSTNSEAARRAPSQATPLWIMAKRQTAGRARSGRQWCDPRGNFAASLLCYPVEPLDKIALRSFIAALAVYDALVLAGVPAQKVQLKWPNDVLVYSRKIAGILLETRQLLGGYYALIIGIGINLMSCPADVALDNPTRLPIALSDCVDELPSQERFLELLAHAYDQFERQYRTFGFEPIRSAWLSRTMHHGMQIKARLPNEEVHGQFDTVDANGQLVLRLADKRTRRIAAAELI